MTKEQLEKGLAKQGIVQFTDKEIQQMPKIFRKLILIQKKALPPTHKAKRKRRHDIRNTV